MKLRFLRDRAAQVSLAFVQHSCGATRPGITLRCAVVARCQTPPGQHCQRAVLYSTRQEHQTRLLLWLLCRLREPFFQPGLHGTCWHQAWRSFFVWLPSEASFPGTLCVSSFLGQQLARFPTSPLAHACMLLANVWVVASASNVPRGNMCQGGHGIVRAQIPSGTS